MDLGYRGVDVSNVTIYKARQKRGVNTRRLKQALKRRNAIEPGIGHLKNGGLLRRNHQRRVGQCHARHPVRRRPQHPPEPPATPGFLPWLRGALSGWFALAFNPLANKLA